VVVAVASLAALAFVWWRFVGRPPAFVVGAIERWRSRLSSPDTTLTKHKVEQTPQDPTANVSVPSMSAPSLSRRNSWNEDEAARFEAAVDSSPSVYRSQYLDLAVLEEAASMRDAIDECDDESNSYAGRSPAAPSSPTRTPLPSLFSATRALQVRVEHRITLAKAAIDKHASRASVVKVWL